MLSGHDRSMTTPTAASPDGIRRLYDLMRRVNSQHELSEVLHEAVNGVVEGLGYGVAAISVLEGETLVMTAVAGPEDVREAILGRRTPMAEVFDEYAHADEWGILRYVPHHRLDPATTTYAWRPDYEPVDDPDAWHPMDTLYAPLLSASGRVLGNMSVDLPPEGRVPSVPQRELLEMFVVQAGLAIAHAQQRAELADRVRLGGVVQAVSALGGERDLHEVLAAAAATLHDGLGVTQVTLRCFDESGDRSELAVGHPGDARGGDWVVDLLADLADLVDREGERPVRLRDGHPDWQLLGRTAERLQGMFAGRGWEEGLVSPLVMGRGVLGYLGLSRSAGEPAFSQAEVAAVQTVGRELGRLLQDARVRERERRLLAELQQLDRYKGELIATISHELKTPLTTIIGHAELLQDDGTGGASTDAIMRSARRLDRLVTELLSYSRVQERPEIVRGRVDLVELARASIDLLSLQSRAGGLEVRLRAEGPVVVEGDREELGRVVDNICGNAVKYTRPGGRVEVVVDSHGDVATVAVTDTGIGISTADQAHLFDAFHRSSNLDALSIPGTGLGLAIARRIARLHGGDVRVESELGRGSTFTLVVPVEAP